MAFEVADMCSRLALMLERISAKTATQQDMAQGGNKEYKIQLWAVASVTAHILGASSQNLHYYSLSPELTSQPWN